jgi:hypothetical protein
MSVNTIEIKGFLKKYCLPTILEGRLKRSSFLAFAIEQQLAGYSFTSRTTLTASIS